MSASHGVKLVPGQQAEVALSVFRGGKHLNWQGHATCALGFQPWLPADATFLGRAGNSV